MEEVLTFDDISIEPGYSEVLSRDNCKLVSRVTKNHTLQIPILSSPMDTITGWKMALKLRESGGLGIVHRFNTIEEQVEMMDTIQEAMGLTDYKIPIGAAVGATGDFLERAQELSQVPGLYVIMIDVAHGHHLHVKRALDELKRTLPASVDIIAGCVATYEGARDLCEWGADAIRVGVGNGSLCETRIRTGIGIPQVTALMNCIEAADDWGIPVIADGGMKTPGDVAKALALGADVASIGSLFAGTRETPGPIKKIGIWPNEQLFKQYQGSTSRASYNDRGAEEKYIEGNSMAIPYRGTLDRILDDILAGIRSSMSYVGANNIEEFWSNSTIVKVTPAGQLEAEPHLLK